MYDLEALTQDADAVTAILSRPENSDFRAALCSDELDSWEVAKSIDTIPDVMEIVSGSGHSGGSWSVVLSMVRDALMGEQSDGRFVNLCILSIAQSGAPTPTNPPGQPG